MLARAERTHLRVPSHPSNLTTRYATAADRAANNLNTTSNLLRYAPLSTVGSWSGSGPFLNCFDGSVVSICASGDSLTQFRSITARVQDVPAFIGLYPRGPGPSVGRLCNTTVVLVYTLTQEVLWSGAVGLDLPNANAWVWLNVTARASSSSTQTPSQSSTVTATPSPSATPWAPGTPLIRTVFGGASDVGAPAAVPMLLSPTLVASDCAGGILTVSRALVRRISSSGNVSTIAGIPFALAKTGGASADGLVTLNNPGGGAGLGSISALSCNASGTFFYESTFARLRYVSSETGVMRTVVGNGTVCNLDAQPGAGPSGVPATSTCLGAVSALAWNGSSTLVLGDASSNLIRAFSRERVFTLAGNGSVPSPALYVDNARWLSTPVKPISIALQRTTGTVFFLDSATNTIRALNNNGSVAHFAGVPFATTATSLSGLARATPLAMLTSSIAFDANGTLYVLISSTPSVLQRVSGGLLTTLSTMSKDAAFSDFTQTWTFSSTSMSVFKGAALAIDIDNNLTYIVDSSHQRIVKIVGEIASGTASIAHGPGSLPHVVAGMPGRSIQLFQPYSIAWEPASRSLVVADGGSSKVHQFFVDDRLAASRTTFSGGLGTNVYSVKLPPALMNATWWN